MDKPLLVLDFDGTIGSHVASSTTMHFRPHLQKFFESLEADYDFAIWSTNEPWFVKMLRNELKRRFGVTTQFALDNTTELKESQIDTSAMTDAQCGRKMAAWKKVWIQRRSTHYKCLDNVYAMSNGKYSSNNTLILDDLWVNSVKNGENGVRVPEWNFEPDRCCAGFFARKSTDSVLLDMIPLLTNRAKQFAETGSVTSEVEV